MTLEKLMTSWMNETNVTDCSNKTHILKALNDKKAILLKLRDKGGAVVIVKPDGILATAYNTSTQRKRKKKRHARN